MAEVEQIQTDGKRSASGDVALNAPVELGISGAQAVNDSARDFSVWAWPVCALLAVLGIAKPDALVTLASSVTGTAMANLDWFFMVTVTALLLLAAWLVVSRHGSLRLGADNEAPEFSYTSWLAMLFAAGMGSGLLFWGVAEPMSHFLNAPSAEASASQAARRAMVITNFHWGLHAWAIYGMAALVLAYFAFRRHKPYLPGAPIRTVFAGPWVEPVAAAADFIAVLSVAFGVAGSVGFGILQLHTGLHVLSGVDVDSYSIRGVILLLLVVSYMASAATNLDKGIKWLSNLNMALAVLLLAFVLFAGPTDFLLRGFVTSIGDYVSGLAGITMNLYPYEDASGWVSSWTLTYFIWWIAWTPFVGVFIARISRGRTIREFILGVVLAPTGFSLLWFSVFGGSGFFNDFHGNGTIRDLVQQDVAVALFSTLDQMPLAPVLNAVAMTLVFVFLVTSVDSATFVLGMLTSRGSVNPPAKKKLLWGLGIAGLSAALMLSGSIAAMKAVTILGAVPFTFVLLLQVAALLRELRKGPGRSEPSP